jgi:hypothetical protein
MNTMSYVVCWDSVYDNCLRIEENLKSNDLDYKVINSSSYPSLNDKWMDIGNVWYYRQFHEALKDFSTTDKDLFCFIVADLVGDFSKVIKTAQEELENKKIGVYAPYFTHEAWGEVCTRIEELNNNLIISTQTDGIFTILNKELASIMLDFFDYLSKEVDLSEMKSGWGVDYAYSVMAICKDYYICRDKRFIITHPVGSSYDHGLATSEMNTFLSAFSNYCENNFIPKAKAEKVFRLINHRRDGGDVSLSELYPSLESWAYHLISINDDRIKNKQEIHRIMSSRDYLGLACLNGNNEIARDKFFADNPEFNISWQGFKSGEVGNFASHFIAWKYLINSSMDRLLVFEDDAVLSENFIDRLNVFIEELPDDWDIFSIFVHPNQYDRYNGDSAGNVVKAYQDWSTLCYAISRSGAKKLYDYVCSNGMDYPTDWFIFRHADEHNFNVFTLNPKCELPVVIDESLPSLVQNTDKI